MLDNPNSGYIRHKYVHGHGDFGLGQESTSHVKSLWGLLKAKIKECYHSVHANQFIWFVKVLELEFKIKYKSLSFADKIDKFFDAFNLTEQVDDGRWCLLKNSFNLFILDDLDNFNYDDEDFA